MSLAPWDQPEAFPARPDSGGYGYLAGNKLRPCTRDELLSVCGRDRVPRINLVWTPQAARLIPAAEVPFLLGAIKLRAARRFRAYIVIGIVAVVAAGFFYCLPGYGTQGPARLDVIGVALAGVLGVVGGARGLSQVRAYTPQAVAGEVQLVRYLIWLRLRRTWATKVLAVSMLIVAAAQVLVLWRASVLGMPSVSAAGLVKSDVQQGEVWRLLTSIYLHGGPVHFAFNLLALLGLARLVEALTRPAYVAMVFLLSGLCGSLASFVWLNTEWASVGASGGLMGLIGFLAALGWRRRAILPPAFLQSVLLGIGLVAVLGAVGYRYVDNAAHVGGLACGLLMGLVLIGKEQRPGDDRAQAWAGLVFALPALALAAVTAWLVLRIA